MIWGEDSCHLPVQVQIKGAKRNPKPKLFGPDMSGWGGGLPREGVGVKKFSTSLETQGNQTFWWDIPGFCRDIPGALEKFKKKSLCSILVLYKLPAIGHL